MNCIKVGKRGTLFQFHDLGIATNVYVIDGKDHVFIVDTYLGPDIMEKINDYITENFGQKPVIVVNTHSDWDHVWGNCYYGKSIIIAHELCLKRMKENGLEEIEKNRQYLRGNVVLAYPNLTFNDRICFTDEGIIIYHTPGHTGDSISVIDLYDKVLYAGDNLEEPHPYIEDVEQYLKTLKSYLELDVDFVIGGHSGVSDKSLILNNMEYAGKLKKITDYILCLSFSVWRL